MFILGHYGWTTKDLRDGADGTKHPSTGSGKYSDWRLDYVVDGGLSCDHAVVVMHMGTEDVMTFGTPYSRVVDEILEARKFFRLVLGIMVDPAAVKFVIAKPIPFAAGGSPKAWELGQAIEAAVGHGTDTKVVDLYSGFVDRFFTSSTYLPNVAGAEWMAARLFPAVFML